MIIKKELLGNPQPITPNLLNYTLIHEGESMSNTPPTFAWYVAGKVFKWLKSIGGVEAIAEINNRKAKKLYDFIDSSDFYNNEIKTENRSIMNVPFLLIYKNPLGQWIKAFLILVTIDVTFYTLAHASQQFVSPISRRIANASFVM